ncbi:MAG: CDP-diacylglycerol--glycerol-3-phosphate 3-phosphatidyltransferase [Bacilli bacterium]|nr:CDP-diacylglycerol--glycerol-3-phosphate 3-phosphatidyltransferase [Bacilli bacterium]
MNLPNKITVSRIILAIIILIMLVIPWHALGVVWPAYDSVFGITLRSPLSLKYIVTGVLFLIASLTDRIDGQIARKRNLVTDLGKMLDAIADKILVNGVLIILAYDHIIPLLVPVVIITRDIITDTCKMVSGNKGKVVAASWTGKIKTVFMMTGTTLAFFGNLPFELIPLDVTTFCLIIGTVLSLVSGCQYYFNTMKVLKADEKKGK